MTSAISSRAIDALKAELASAFPDVRFDIRQRASFRNNHPMIDVMYKSHNIITDEVWTVCVPYEDRIIENGKTAYIYIINLADGEE